MQSAWSIGVDVGKDDVMVACHEAAAAPQKIVRACGALSRWLATLPQGSRLGVEATGGYHELVADLASGAGLTVYVLNPRDVRCYARALGMRGKTDRLDAQVIARYVAEHAHRLHPFTPLTEDEKRLRDLERRRATLVTIQGMLRQSLSRLPGFEPEAELLRLQTARLIRRLEAKLVELAKANPARAKLVIRLRTIVGVGPLTSVRLATLLTRVRFKRADALIAFLGLDPRPQDSGRARGRRRLSKRGPSEDRRLLYNAGMAAVKTPTWRALYQHLRARGLATTEAIVIIARRILRIGFAMFKHETDFDPKLVPQP